MFPTPQGSHSRKESRWSPMATKTFPATSKCSDKSSKANPTFSTTEQAAPAHKPPIQLPTLPKGWWVLHRRIKKMQSPTLEFEKTACASHKKSKDFQFIKAARTELKEPPVLWHHSHSRLPLSNTISVAILHLCFWLQVNYKLCFPDTISLTLRGCVTLIKATGKVQGRVLQPLV